MYYFSSAEKSTGQWQLKLVETLHLNFLAWMSDMWLYCSVGCLLLCAVY